MVKILSSSVIPIKVYISEVTVTSKCRRQLKALLEVSAVLTRKGPLSRLKLASIASQHGVAAVAEHFLRRTGRHG